MLQVGDIFATKGTGVWGWLASSFMSPKTDRFHFGIIKQKIHYEDLDGEIVDDWETIESLGKGVSVARFSDYKGYDLKFYRIVAPEDLLAIMPEMLTALGRAKYDYKLFIKIALQGIWLLFWNFLKEGRFRRVRYDELTSGVDAAFICTELVDWGSRLIGYDLVPENITPTPAALEQARLENRMFEIER
jgi:hypothetical protein